MKILKDHWWVFLTLVGITLIFFIAPYYEGKIPTLEPNKEEPLDILTKVAVKLILVGALLDQFIAVFFPQDETDKEERVQALNTLSIAKDEEKLIRKEMLNVQLQGSAASIQKLDSQLASFRNTKQVAKDKIATTDSDRSAYVRRVAFVIGLIIAMTGVTILRDFFDMSSDALNHKMLSYIDIIFTAAVLSGGTSGINQLIRVLKDSWKQA
ncbi:hypothetical protein [Winogradskyella sp.]|uniref:hypothetical protein n=1 Tax=Winogradskyella sp. TaxID=1883156 RepID=UPI00260D2320|nr:hypothetical protein [Winogradskyella sp.]